MAARRAALGWTLLGLLVVAVAARAALPSIVRSQLEKRINAAEGYEGWVQDVDLAVARGVMTIKGLRVFKKDQPEAPLFVAPSLTLAVRWSDLFSGRLVASCLLDRPTIVWVNHPGRREAKPHPLKREDRPGRAPPDWREQLQRLGMLRIDRFEVREGVIRYRDPKNEPPVDIRLESIGALGANLTNRRGDTATVQVQAKPMGSGDARIEVRAKPLIKTPTFDLNLALRDLEVAKLNPLLRSKAKLDVERGAMDFFMEAAAREGRVKGYAKPVLRGLDVTGGRRKNPLKKLWEGVAQAGVEIFDNEKTGQVAARVPFEGPVPEPDAGVWPGVVSVVRNAFVEALAPTLEGSIGFERLRAAPGPKPKK